jgi:hypothetical protein
VLALVAVPGSAAAQAPVPAPLPPAPSLGPSAASEAAATAALGAPARYVRRVGGVEIWVTRATRRLSATGPTTVAAFVCSAEAPCAGAVGTRLTTARKGISVHAASHISEPPIAMAPFSLAPAATHQVAVTPTAAQRRRLAKTRRDAEVSVFADVGGLKGRVAVRLRR